MRDASDTGTCVSSLIPREWRASLRSIPLEQHRVSQDSPATMLSGDVLPNQTIYIKNLNEKVKKDVSSLVNISFFNWHHFKLGLFFRPSLLSFTSRSLQTLDPVLFILSVLCGSSYATCRNRACCLGTSLLAPESQLFSAVVNLVLVGVVFWRLENEVEVTGVSFDELNWCEFSQATSS
ncbi:sensitivity to red-light reduced protein [Asimina triloba]